MTLTPRKATWLSSLGAGLEYYDFIIYGMMASTLDALFFATSNPLSSLMKTFAIFAVGYLARPFGGLLFGLLGDSLGRKKSFLAVMFLMAFATFVIGLLPTYKQVGSLAPFLLLACRILQGFSFGAELPGAIVVVNEFAPRQRRGIYSGFVISSTSLGSLLASFLLYLITSKIPQGQLLSYGWRLPFLLGGGLAVANLFIRRYLNETPAFLSVKKSTLIEPLLQLFSHHKRELLAGIGLAILPASLVIFALYLYTYFRLYYGYAPSEIYFAAIPGMIWSALSLPLAGWLSDRWGYKKVYLFTALLFFLAVHPLFALPLIPFMILYQSFLSLLMASFFPLLSSLFPTRVRFTGVALCYNLVFALMGSLPLFATYLIEKTNHLSALWLLSACALLSSASISLAKASHGK